MSGKYMPTITRFDQPTTPGSIDHPRPDRLEQGNPRRETWALYASADGLMSSGIWACEVGRWRIAFPAGKEEYFFVLAGQGAVIPAGFEGAFEVVSPVRKHFVVVDRAA